MVSPCEEWLGKQDVLLACKACVLEFKKKYLLLGERNNIVLGISKSSKKAEPNYYTPMTKPLLETDDREEEYRTEMDKTHQPPVWEDTEQTSWGD